MRVLLLALAIWTVSHPASAQDINRARLAWSAFSCGMFAKMAGDIDEQQRLFQLGYQNGREFLEAVMNQTISEEEMKGAPIGVTMLLGGPSADFALGRIFESAIGDAYDTVVKRDSAGTLLAEPSEWVMDDEVQKIIAKTKYQQSNCALIR